MTEVLEYRIRENCTLVCCEREENKNVSAITFLLEEEETKREKLVLSKNFHKLKKINTINSSFCILQNNLKTIFHPFLTRAIVPAST